MNVTEDDLRRYIELFHETLSSTAEQFLQGAHRSQLQYASLLPAHIIGYVSTQFGTAVEYVPCDRTKVETIRGSGRVEDLLVRAPSAVRNWRPMIYAGEGHPDQYSTGGLYKVTLEGSFPFRLVGQNSGIRIEESSFKIGGWRRDVRYAEVFGNRSLAFWDPSRAIARAKDEVLAALAQVNRSEQRSLNLAEYIAKFNQKTVLVLGAYDSVGIERLRCIAAAVESSGYDPILVCDVPDIPQQDLSQKVATLGSLSRFVLVDDSYKSGHLTEVQLCRTHNWLTVLLREVNKGASWMTVGASLSSNVILEHGYEQNQLDTAISQAIAWAEAKITELGMKFESTYPWRMRA